MLELIARGTSIGLSAGVIPGPLQALLLSSTLMLGWKRTLPVIFSPLITDIPIAFVCVVLLKELPDQFLLAIQLVGGLFVIWLAYRTWITAQKPMLMKVTEDPPPTRDANPLLRAAMINFVSPGPYIFWSTINGPLLVQALNQSVLHGIAFLFSFYGTFLGLLALLLMIFARIGSLDPQITRRVVLFSAVVMALFGVSLLWQAVSGLMV